MSNIVNLCQLMVPRVHTTTKPFRLLTYLLIIAPNQIRLYNLCISKGP